MRLQNRIGMPDEFDGCWAYLGEVRDGRREFERFEQTTRKSPHLAKGLAKGHCLA